VVEQPDIWIVVPCYNEAQRLQVEQYRGYVATDPRVRFVFVNDGSRDDTRGVLSRLCASDPERFELLDQTENRGKAAAVRIGMLHALAAGARFAGYWDADLATPLREIPRFMAALDGPPSHDICFGSRVRLLGRSIDRRPLRHYLGRLFATVASLAVNLPVYDTQCGAKLFRVSDATPLLFAEPFCVNWTFDVEIIARVQSLRAELGSESTAEPRRRFAAALSIYELPLNEWRDVAGSKVRPRDFVRGLVEMLRIVGKYGRGGSKHPLRLPAASASATVSPAERSSL
jgi:glycosyltransferase involved in cell wall biosynthesis